MSNQGTYDEYPLSNQDAKDQFPLTRQTLKRVMKLIPLSLIGPFVLIIIAMDGWDAPHLLVAGLGIAFLLPVAMIFWGIVTAWAQAGPIMIERRKATPEEQIAQQEKQAVLLQQKIKKAEVEKEFLKKQVEVAELENHLKTLRSGKPEDERGQKLQDDFERRIKNIKDRGKIIELAEEEKRQHPELEEYYQVVIDRLRRQLLADE